MDYSHDDGSAGETVSITDPGGNVSETVSDTSGLEMETSDIDGGDEMTVRNRYDESGRKTMKAYEDGSYVKNSYDTFGNVTEKEYHRDDHTDKLDN